MKKIIKHLKKNWIRHGFETLVVVVGVLIAFTLNNWNEIRKDSMFKKQLISNLILELYSAKSDLASSIEHADKVVIYGSLFLEIVGTNNETIPVDSIKSLARLSTSKILYKLTLSAYDESKSSGRLSLLDNIDITKGYSEIFVALEDYHHHFPIAGQVFYTGSVWNYREKYGSLRVLRNKSEEVPQLFRVSDEEYRKMIVEPLTFGMIENFNTLNDQILSSLLRLDKSITEVIGVLEEM